MDKLISYIRHPATSLGTLLSLLGFSTVFFFVYWWFREQVCIVVCPYGRLQGVLLDKNSIVVAYDNKRGEPRGKHRKGEEQTAAASETSAAAATNGFEKAAAVQHGDCIDCFACVRVCPTGIDIRNGTQLECVNCTACIDACDAIMDGINKPRGLVRYASVNSIAKGEKLKLTWRVKAYSAVLTLLLSLLVFLLASRSDLDVRLMRTSGMTFTTLPDGRIANLYTLKLINKTHEDIPFTLKLENVEGEITQVGAGSLLAKKEDYANVQFFVKLKKKNCRAGKPCCRSVCTKTTRK